MTNFLRGISPLIFSRVSVYNPELYSIQVRLVSQRRLRKIISAKRIAKMASFYDDEDDEFEFKSEITHGESIADRKSVFQGHCAGISKKEHVEQFLDKLRENKKIDTAFHNMWAYRIDKNDSKAKLAGKSASILQDCDDDGEQAAGGRLLSLLEILNVVNVMVVVTRWYGGIQLGPARFKHINNAARDALVKGRFVSDSNPLENSDDPKSTTSSTTNSKQKSKSKGTKIKR